MICSSTNALEKKNDIPSQNNKITNQHLSNLDNFIQTCLNKFKFVKPQQEFYDATGDDADNIISHKSTIPDLVIWNKKFNKNMCFHQDGITNVENVFPRFTFVLRIEGSDSDKEKKKDKKIEKMQINQGKNVQKQGNGIITTNININEINRNVFDDINDGKKINNLNELDINNIIEYTPTKKKSEQFHQKHIENNPYDITDNMNQNNFVNNDINFIINNNNYINQFQLNLNIDRDEINILNYSILERRIRENPITCLIKEYTSQDGWIAIDISNGNILGFYNSCELYLYLSKINNLLRIEVIDKNKQVRIPAEKMFNFLSQYCDFIIISCHIQYEQKTKIEQQINQSNPLNTTKNNTNFNPMNSINFDCNSHLTNRNNINYYLGNLNLSENNSLKTNNNNIQKKDDYFNPNNINKFVLKDFYEDKISIPDSNHIKNDEEIGDNDEFNNISNLIFNNPQIKNSKSKSNNENNEDGNTNDYSQFESNNDYQIDNYNSIFS